MLIIVEGPDGSGKTTLLNFISKKTGIEIVHGGGPPKTTGEIYNRVISLFDNPVGLYDRTTIISEQVYGPVIRRARLIEVEQWDQWMKRLGDAGAIIIYCRPPELTLREFAKKLEAKPHKSPGHVRKVKESIDEIIKFYDRVIRRAQGLGIQVIRFDRTTTKLSDFYKGLVASEVIPKKSEKDQKPQETGENPDENSGENFDLAKTSQENSPPETPPETEKE